MQISKKPSAEHFASSAQDWAYSFWYNCGYNPDLLEVKEEERKTSESGYELTSPLAMNLTESTRNEDLPLQFNMISSFSMHDIIRKYGVSNKYYNEIAD